MQGNRKMGSMVKRKTHNKNCPDTGFCKELKADAFDSIQITEWKYGLNELTYRDSHKKNKIHKKERSANSINVKSIIDILKCIGWDWQENEDENIKS